MKTITIDGTNYTALTVRRHSKVLASLLYDLRLQADEHAILPIRYELGADAYCELVAQRSPTQAVFGVKAVLSRRLHPSDIMLLCESVLDTYELNNLRPHQNLCLVGEDISHLF